MEEWLGSLSATGVTAVTLIISFFVAQVRGWVYVKPQVDEIRLDKSERIAEIRADRDARLADKEAQIQTLWAAIGAAEDARAIAAEQNGKMLEGLEATVKVVQAIPKAGE